MVSKMAKMATSASTTGNICSSSMLLSKPALKGKRRRAKA
jgi:hypothetical protein